MKIKYIVSGMKEWSPKKGITLLVFTVFQFSNKTIIRSEEYEIYFENIFMLKKWVKEMGKEVILPDAMKGLKYDSRII